MIKRQRIFYCQVLDQQQTQPLYQLAANQTQLRQALLSQGKLLLQVIKKQSVTARQLKPPLRLQFTQQLLTLLQAGLPLLEALQLLLQQQRELYWCYLLQQLMQQINQGHALADALQQFPQVFNQLYLQTVRIGEESGTLEESLTQLARQQQQQLMLQQQVRQALRYPLFLLIVALLVTLLMLLVVLPKFSAIYQQFNAPLPAFTQLLLMLSTWLQAHWLLLLLLILITLLLLQQLASTRQRLLQWLSHRLPLLRRLQQQHQLNQFFMALAMTQQAGMPLLNSLRLNQQADFSLLLPVPKLIQALEQGLPLSDVINQYSLPPICYQLLKVGEESGKLDEMLHKLAEHFFAQTEQSCRQLSQLVEPLMMLLLATMVGGMVVAIYLPIFQLSQVIG